MSDSLQSSERLERLLDAARWLRLAGDAEGAVRLLEQARRLAPEDIRVAAMLELPRRNVERLPVQKTVAPSVRPGLRPTGTPRWADSVSLEAGAVVWEDAAGETWEGPFELTWEEATRAQAPRLPEVAVLFVSQGPALEGRVSLCFDEGPLAGQTVNMGHQTLHLGEPGESPRLFVKRGGLYAKARGEGPVYVAIRGEVQLKSPSYFRAGQTEFLYERRKDEAGSGELHFLHTLGRGRTPARTYLVREPVLSVGRSGVDFSLPQDTALAPRHLELTPGPWATFLEDCSAGAGTFLQQPGGTAGPLRAGDRVFVDGHGFTVQSLPT